MLIAFATATNRTRKCAWRPASNRPRTSHKKLKRTSLFKSKLELFTSFENLDTVDAVWDNTLTAKVSKYFAVNLNVYLFYDEDILSEMQVKQTLAFGVTYTFF